MTQPPRGMRVLVGRWSRCLFSFSSRRNTNRKAAHFCCACVILVCVISQTSLATREDTLNSDIWYWRRRRSSDPVNHVYALFPHHSYLWRLFVVSVATSSCLTLTPTLRSSWWCHHRAHRQIEWRNCVDSTLTCINYHEWTLLVRVDQEAVGL